MSHRPGQALRVSPDPRTTVVVLSYDCRARIAATVAAARALPESPPVVVVDNASRDGTADLVASRFPDVELVRLPVNIGAAARNVGVQRSRTPYVAFADDDVVWEPGALAAAADLLDAHPRLAVVNARILVGDERRLDPICAEMADSPLPNEPPLPGTAIISFMAGAIVVRTQAYLQAGGYPVEIFIGGEEEWLSTELAAAGWQLRYVPEVVCRHLPSRANYQRLRPYGVRNALWLAWRKRPAGAALRWTWHLLRHTPPSRSLALGAAMAVAGLPTVLRDREPLPASVEGLFRLLEPQKRSSQARRYG